ncbi:hypothetical protein [Brevundimonas bullata]|uniref:hypothetical protein n=1 Tax=Brevundimonas bullata TaxID=13160 RepID=UPI003D9A6391
MHPVQIILILANLIAFALLLWRGGTVERWAVLALTAAQVLSVLSVPWDIDGLRIGVMLVDVALFAALWGLAEHGRRWWLVACAGFQLIIVVSHLAPFFAHERLGWAAVTLQWVAWTFVSLTAFVGVWEAGADRRFVREESDGARMDHEHSPRAAASVE